MGGTMLKTLRIAYAAVALAVLVVEDLLDGQPGVQKKAEAIGRVKELVAAILGHWPAWLPDQVIGWAIDMTVAIFNRDGTFRKGQESNNAPGKGA